MTQSNVCNLEVKSTIEICQVKFPKFNATTMVPALDENYVFPEVTFDVLHDIMETRPMILTGHSGTGKSSLISQIAARAGQTLIRVNLNDQMTIEDFVGTNSLINRETVWIDGFLVKAMREGWWITLEEIDFAPPEILVYLNTLLEKDGYIVLKEKGFEIIHPHKDFRIFATANTVGSMSRFSYLYPGARKLNDAFLDRFRIHLIPYLPEEKEIEVITAVIKEERFKRRSDPVKPGFEDKLKEMASYYVKVANAMRSGFENDTISSNFSSRRLIDWVEASSRHKDVLSGAKLALFSKMSEDDAKVFKRTIETIFNPIYTKNIKT